jgi:hypothetical protein
LVRDLIHSLQWSPLRLLWLLFHRPSRPCFHSTQVLVFNPKESCKHLCGTALVYILGVFHHKVYTLIFNGAGCCMCNARSLAQQPHRDPNEIAPFLPWHLSLHTCQLDCQIKDFFRLRNQDTIATGKWDARGREKSVKNCLGANDQWNWKLRKMLCKQLCTRMSTKLCVIQRYLRDTWHVCEYAQRILWSCCPDTDHCGTRRCSRSPVSRLTVGTRYAKGHVQGFPFGRRLGVQRGFSRPLLTISEYHLLK